MNFIQIKYFVTVAEFGTVSAAADYLHIAQPSVSLAIKELENEFGALLFHRKHKGMSLTEEGSMLLTMARDILERTETAKKIMREVGENKKVLKIGIPPMIASLILPALYEGFVSENSETSLDISEGSREELLEAVENDRVDIAFITHKNLPDVSLEFLHIATLKIVCAASPKNPTAKKEMLTPSDLASAPLVIYKDGFFQSAEIKSWFSNANIEPNILMKTNQLSTMTKVISSGAAIGFLFERLTDNERDIVPIPTEPRITAEVSLVWKKQNFSVSGIKKLKEFLKSNDLFK